MEGSWTPINSYYGESPKQKSTLKSSFKRAKSETNSNQNSSDYDIEIVSRDYLQNMSEWNNTPIKSESIGANSGTLMKMYIPVVTVKWCNSVTK